MHYEIGVNSYRRILLEVRVRNFTVFSRRAVRFEAPSFAIWRHYLISPQYPFIDMSFGNTIRVYF